jgi:hypothetical protein
VILRLLSGSVGLLLLLLATDPAAAVPAFAVQTGQPCQTCHIGAFGPQLTPFGRQFKMNGYTLRAGDTFTPPVSGMAIASFVHTQKDQPEPPAPGTHRNDNTALDEAAVFLAGGYGHVGGFAEITYEGLDHKWTWDNLDVRAVDHANLLGHDVLLGLSLNNSPTVQDVWATLPAWGFPFTDSDLMPGPDAATLISDALAQNVLGLNAYAWWDDHLYTEAGLYRSLSADFLKNVGVDPEETNDLDGAAPYLRAAWQQNYGDQNVEFGAFALFADFFPGRDRSTGKTDHFTDLGLDASYQFTGTGEHIFTLNSRYIHEIQTLDATQALGGTLSRDLNLNEININASYYYKNTYGVSAGAFGVWGDGDPLLYADSRTFSPDSQGFILQADVTPFGGDNPPLGTRVNVRVGLQYVVFTKFNGASSNFDGLGHNASDNNTLRLFLWTAF